MEGCTAVFSEKDEILSFLRSKVVNSLDVFFNGLPEIDIDAVRALGYCGEQQDLALLEKVSSKRPGLFTVDRAERQIQARLKAADSKSQQSSTQH